MKKIIILFLSIVGFFFLIFFLWASLSSEDVRLFYDDESKLYIKLCLFKNDDYGHIYLGHTKEDIENGSDYFKVNRVDWGMNRAIVYRSKETDSIFVQGSNYNQIKIIRSSNFIISPLVQGTIEVTMYNQITGERKKIHATDYNYDLRFRMHDNDYWYYDITMDSPKSVKHYLGVSDCYNYNASRYRIVPELKNDKMAD